MKECSCKAFLTNLGVSRAFDGVPTTNDKEEGPTSPKGSIANSKVQALAHIVEESLK